mgnify:FL=1|tara:strand:- start:1039 stop:2103 length:1065 start_codon:yes stop_codon:yes gene_type:complete
MSYQSYLSNRDLQESLQNMFGQVQTEDEVTQNEEQQTEDQNKAAISEQRKGEEEAGGEATTLGLGELATTGFLKSVGKKVFGDVIDSAKEKLSQTLSDAKSGLTSEIQSQVDSATGGLVSKAGQVKSQLQSVAEGAESDAAEISSNLNVAGRSFFSRFAGTNTTETAPRSGMSFQNGLLDNEEFGESDVTLATDALRSGFTPISRVLSSTGGTSAVPTSTSMGLPSVADLDALTSRGVAYTGPSGSVELPSVTRAAAEGTSNAEEMGTSLVENVVSKAAPLAEAAAGAETGEVATGILAGLEVPGLDVLAGIAGIGFGLYELFHHSSHDAPPPPPSAAAPVGVNQQVATVQAGI